MKSAELRTETPVHRLGAHWALSAPPGQVCAATGANEMVAPAVKHLFEAEGEVCPNALG